MTDTLPSPGDRNAWPCEDSNEMLSRSNRQGPGEDVFAHKKNYRNRWFMLVDPACGCIVGVAEMLERVNNLVVLTALSRSLTYELQARQLRAV